MNDQREDQEVLPLIGTVSDEGAFGPGRPAGGEGYRCGRN